MSDWHDPLQPPNQTALEGAVGRATSPTLDPEVIRTLWNPWTIPAPLLPWLAWALSVDEWDSAWPVATQRAVCAASFPIHKRKGTVGAVRRACASVGYRGWVREWWQQIPLGVPHTFHLDVEIERGIDNATLASLDRQIASVKPERSHYTLRVFATTHGAPKVAAVTLSGEITRLLPYAVTTLTVAAQPRVAAVTTLGDTATVYPQ